MTKQTVLSIGLFTLAALAPAGVQAEEPSAFDRVWAVPVLYENKDNRIIQKLAFVGRLQLDSVWVNPDSPDDAENWDDLTWRRARFGFKANLFNEWTAHIEGDFNLETDLNDMYNKLTDAYIAYEPGNSTKIKAFKHSAGFTLDGKTSSKNLISLERNNITNNLWFTKEYFTGLSVSGRIGDGWNYNGGIFSSGGDPEWDFDTASWFSLLSLGRKIAGADVRFDYVYQDEDENANTRDFEQVFSLSSKWENDKNWGVNGEIAAGIGFEDMGQSDVWGLFIEPYYNLSKRTQVVGYYTYLSSDGDNGLRLNKYENKITDERGDEYSDLYLGFNIYFYDHKFKWQTGITYAQMDDAAGDGGEYKGYTISTGLRVSW